MQRANIRTAAAQAVGGSGVFEDAYWIEDAECI